GLRPVIYTGRGMWHDVMGSGAGGFSDVPLHDFAGDIQGWPESIDEAPIFQYGGWNTPATMRSGGRCECRIRRQSMGRAWTTTCSRESSFTERSPSLWTRSKRVWSAARLPPVTFSRLLLRCPKAPKRGTLSFSTCRPTTRT